MRSPYSDLKSATVSLDDLVAPFLPSCSQSCFCKSSLPWGIILPSVGPLVVSCLLYQHWYRLFAHFREESCFGHHILFVFLSVCSLRILACTTILHLIPLLRDGKVVDNECKKNQGRQYLDKNERRKSA